MFQFKSSFIFRYLSVLMIPALCVAAFLYVQTPSTAQAPPTKIGVVDTETVFMQSNVGKKAMADYKAVQDGYIAQATAIQDEIRRLSASKAAQPANAAAIDKQIADRTLAYRRTVSDGEAASKSAKDRMLENLDAKIMPVINAVGKEQKFATILRKFESGVIYVDDSIDITNVVIARLNALP